MPGEGIFITFEGVEGSGKTTQIALLAERLKRLGYDVVQTREPGGTPLGAAIRKIALDPATGALNPLTEALMFAGARRELVTKVIQPALANGQVVLCDRFADSTTAYQGAGRGVDMGTITALAKMVCSGIWPTMTILLDIEPEQGLERAMDRMNMEGYAESRFEEEKIDFHKRVRTGFLEIARLEPDRVKVIKADGDKNAVHTALWEAIQGLVSRKGDGC